MDPIVEEHFPGFNNNFLTELRSETKAAHQALENHPMSVAVLSPGTNLTLYVHYLEKFYGFLKPVEHAAYLAEAPVPDAGERVRTPLLEKDLAYFNIDSTKIPEYKDVTYINNDEARLGAMYVLEGSTLGGQVISRLLQKHLELTPDTGMAYFSGRGKDTGPMWHIFLKNLSQFAAQTPERSKIIDAAIQTFTALYHWLDHSNENQRHQIQRPGRPEQLRK